MTQLYLDFCNPSGEFLARTAADGPEPPTIAAIASRRSPLAAADLDQVVTDPADAAGLLAALRLRQGPVLVLVDGAERIDDSDHALAELLAESPLLAFRAADQHHLGVFGGLIPTLNMHPNRNTGAGEHVDRQEVAVADERIHER